MYCLLFLHHLIHLVYLSYGNRVTIKGDTLIIVDNEYGKKFKCFKSSNVRTFVQKPYTQEEIKEKILSSVSNHILEDLYSEMWSDCFKKDIVSSLRSIRNCVSLSNVKLTSEKQSILFDCDEDIEIYVTLNIEELQTNGLTKESMSISLLDKATDETKDGFCVSMLIEDYILSKKSFDNENEEDYDYDWD